MKNTAMMLLFLLSSYTWSFDQASKDVSYKADSLLLNMKSWENNHLKSKLSERISENQHLLDFINTYHAQLMETDHDRAYEYFSKTLIEDQSSLVFIGENFSDIGTSESLDLDGVLASSAMLNTEFENMMKYSLRLSGSKYLVNRILYYGLMEKYSSIQKI